MANANDDDLELKVNITDKLSKLTQTFEQMEGKGSFVLFKGKLIQEPDDVTFQKVFAGDGAQFLLVNAGTNKPPIKWVRFPEFYLTDYYYMNTTYYDAVTFIPKVAIHFCGFGIFANYNSKDVKYKIMWAIDGEKSEEFEYEFADGDKDPEKKWFEI